MGKQFLITSIVHWLLVIVTVFYLLTGFGITEFRIVETITFGLLTKSLAFKIHDILWIPFIILLILHICLTFIVRARLKSNINKQNST